MILEITVGSWLTRFLDNKQFESKDVHQSQVIKFKIDEPLALTDILEDLHIPVDECGIVIFNGQRILIEDIIKTNGKLKIYPPILGG